MRLVPGARQLGGQVRHLLADPEMASLLAAAPQAVRLLRPLLGMLGIEASLIRPPPAPVVAQESTDEGFVAAPLVRPSYPPGGEVSAVVPDGEARHPEVFARA